MAQKAQSLIRVGENPSLITGASLFHNLTQSNDVSGVDTAQERLKHTTKHQYYPIEFFGAIVCVLQELYNYFPVEYIKDLATLTEKTLYYFEKQRREAPENEPKAITFLGTKLSFEVDLRELYKKQYNTKPSSNNMRKYVEMFRSIARTPILFEAETKYNGDTLTTSIKEPLLRFAPLPIELGEIRQGGKRGDKPYKITLDVNVMSVYRILSKFVRFPNDLPQRLTAANTDNPVYKALIYPLLERRSDIDKKGRAYMEAKLKGKKDLPPYPFKYDYHISQINEMLNLQGYSVRPYRLENYIINAFDAFRDKVGIIYKYEIIKNQKGEIVKVEFHFNSMFYREAKAPNNQQINAPTGAASASL